jgi:hydrogenase large subunit
MASVRSLDNALTVSQVSASGGDVSAIGKKITEDDGITQIPDNGRIIRNLIHGADTVMSHITHFYALAALDYVDVSHLGPVWDPTYVVTDLLPGGTTMPNGLHVATNYVISLSMRRKAHTMSAIFSGRHPIQNAIVPGGVSTHPTTTDTAAFSSLLDQVRNFINTTYIPDVVTVATHPWYSAHWVSAPEPGNLLSYGDFPIQTGTNAENLLLHRGVYGGGAPVTTGPTAFLANVREHVAYSYYDYPLDPVTSAPYPSLDPHSGNTTPNVNYVNDTTHYSWLKAPRFLSGSTSLACEVGPLPRMFVTYLGAPTWQVSQSGTASGVPVTRLSLPNINTALPINYTVTNLVTGALTAVNGSIPGTYGPSVLISLLGRHACRALECKLIADAMADTGLTQPNQAWLTELKANGETAPVYVYGKLPKKIALGSGWAEAPRGALGHWITIDKKRIANYQCVVPTTWNHSPRDSNDLPGAAEQALEGIANVGTGTDTQILNVLRYLHPYDFCIACAVHMIRPDGTTIAKVKMDTDGKVTKLPLDAEI